MSSKHAPGTVVWAKIKGYPWWPAKIKKEEEIPSAVLKQKPNRPVPVISVKFFGTKDYGWISSDNIKPFEEHLQEFNKGRRGVQFDRAVKEASNPDAQVTDSEEEMHAVEEEELVSEDDEPPKRTPKRSGRKKAEPRRKSRGKDELDDASDSELEEEKKTKKTPNRRTSGRRSSRIKQIEVDEEEADRSSARKRKSSPAEESTPKRRRSSRKDKSVEEPAEAKEEEQEPLTLQRGKQKSKPRSSSEKLMYLRHKLQKMTMKDVIGDMNLIDSLMKEVESFDMNLSLLRETKIGKLMKRVSQLELDEDPFDIKDRAYALTKKWRSLLIEDVLSDKQQANEEESEKLDEVDAEVVPMEVDQEKSKVEDAKLNEIVDTGSEAETEIETQLSSGGHEDDEDNKVHVSDVEEEPNSKNNVTNSQEVDVDIKEADSGQLELNQKPEESGAPSASDDIVSVSKPEVTENIESELAEKQVENIDDNSKPSTENEGGIPSSEVIELSKIADTEKESNSQMAVDSAPMSTDLKEEFKPLKSDNTEVQNSENSVELKEEIQPNATNGGYQSLQPDVNEVISQDEQVEKDLAKNSTEEQSFENSKSMSHTENPIPESSSNDDSPKLEEETQASMKATAESSEAQSEAPSEPLKAEGEIPEESEFKKGEEKTE